MNASLLPITIVPSERFQADVFHIGISPSLSRYWDLDATHPHFLILGGKKIEVTVEESPVTRDEIHCSQSVFSYFSLAASETRLLSRYLKKRHTIVLGPVIGLLTDFESSPEGEPHFRSIHAFCGEVQSVMEESGGLFYVFNLSTFIPEKPEGYIFINGCWRKEAVPLPDVVYNRIHSRRLESDGSFRLFRDFLSLQGIPIFNERFLAKDEAHLLLYEEEHLKPYIPVSMIAGEESLNQMWGKYDSLYIKPVNGSQGRNIIRAAKNEKGIIAELSTGKKSEKPFPDNARFWRWLKAKMKHRDYIIQQSIPLLNYKNRQLDFRVLCHKNYQDDWRAVSVIARISADRQFVSNLAQGGELFKPVSILSILFDRKTAIQQLALMKELAIEASAVISSKMDGIIGELGIDIGIDQKGKLWIIEANSKPSKNNEAEHRKARPSAMALVEYSTSFPFKNPAVKEDI